MRKAQLSLLQTPLGCELLPDSWVRLQHSEQGLYAACCSLSQATEMLRKLCHVTCGSNPSHGVLHMECTRLQH